MTIEIVAGILGGAIAVLAVALLVLVWWSRGAGSDYKAALDAGATASRNQLTAEAQRDAEHTARVAAEAVATDLRAQLTATQQALATAQKELVRHVHDAIASGAPGALDAFRSVFAEQLSPASDPAHARAGGGAPAAPAVPAAGPAQAAKTG